MKNLRLAYVTEWFPPEPDGVSLWIAQAMRDRGFDVGIVTGVPHYPGGELAQGYEWYKRKKETVEGFGVLRVPEFPSHDRSPIRRMTTYGSFAASSAWWGSRAVHDADVCLVYSSPATSALAAMVAQRRYGVPYVLLIQDLWPDSLVSSGLIGSSLFARKLARAADTFVNASYRHASHVVVISPGMRTALVQRGIPADKVSVVYNWVDETVLKPKSGDGALRRLAGLDEDAFALLFAGNQGEAQGLDAWVKAVALLDDRPEVHLLLVGPGTQRPALLELAERLNVSDRVHLLPPVPVERVAELTADADVCVVALRDEPLYRMTLPSKLQATLAQAKPVICSVAGDASEVVSAAGAGWVAEPDDARSIAATVRVALNAGPGERAARGSSGHHYYLDHMSREVGSRHLASILHDAATK